jgi:arylsulfatase A-like enzyme/Tfp pilus assembly protein PilF
MRSRVLTLLGMAAGLAAAPVLVRAADVTTRPNVLLVTIDTLRADHVGAYGYAAARTPSIDRLAREGVLVHDAVVQVPQTRPSHTSIFTGRNPYEHGIRDNASRPLKPGTPTLASTLRAAGYDSAAFIGAFPVSRTSGLDQGFATFDDPFGAGELATTQGGEMERRAVAVVDPALRWLRRPRTAPFFAWVHLFDPHAPYEPPAAFVNKTRPYDGEVAYADSQLGRLLAWLDQSGQRARTLVIVTSDHGEGLGDHGEDEHLFFVYDSTLRVPLVFSWPGRLPAAARVGGQFRSVDLMTTLLELVGVAAPPTSGVSRAAALRAGGRIPENESYAESLYGQLHFGYAPLRALRADGWKYIEAPKAELYRLAEDPGETKNLLYTRATVGSSMRSKLVAHDKGAGSPPTDAVADDPAALERLAALGYVGGGGFKGGAPSGADPKDRIGEFQSYRRDVVKALRLYREGQLAGAIALLRKLASATTREGDKVLERRSFNVDYYLGRSLLDSGRPAEAVRPLESAVAQSPTAAPAWAYLAEAYRASGRLPDATEAIARGLARTPENPELLAMRGRILLEQGDTAAARVTLEKARALDPRDARVRVDLANLYRGSGDLARARAEAEDALRLDPKSAEAQVAWGLVLGALGREPEAAQAFRAALKLKPDQADALFYLGSVELRAGRPAAAVPLFERLLRKAPRYPGAEASLAAARAGAGSAGPTAPAVPSASAPPARRDGIPLRLIRVRDRDSAEAALRRAAAGEDFAALARELSEDASAPRGGDLGTVRPADLAEPLRSAAAALAAGHVSAVLEIPGGYVILKRDR